MNAALVGAVTAVLGAFPVAALCALVYRFPIPMAGYESGPTGAVHALFGVAIYGVFLGGFVVLAGCGALLAALMAWMRPPTPDGARRDDLSAGLIAGLAVDVISIGLLANWDYIYGPW